MSINQQRTELINLKKNGEMYRQGIVFKTSQNSYLYDTGTGKVALLDSNAAPVISALLDSRVSVSEFESLLSYDSVVSKIASFLIDEHLLCTPKITHFLDLDPIMSEELLQCEQLIIELTGKCNMRCKYCTYNDHYDNARCFNNESIDFNTAKKAIDYAYSHRSNKMFAITFYGGEPLLNFEVMKQSINYCLTAYKDVKTNFAFTTNLTLMTQERAEYFAQVPNLSIVVSLDGPEEIHDQNRRLANGAPSFKVAFCGLQNLCRAIQRFGHIEVMINTVLMPPYTKEKFSQINEFFESLAFMPSNAMVSATYPVPGSIPEAYMKSLYRDGYKPEKDVDWVQWAIGMAVKKNCLPISPNLYSDFMRKSLGSIHNRRLVDEPIDKYCWNACCIPANRRLYVCTNGNYKVCEKIGEAPIIGHVDTGIDFETVKKYYLSQYEQASIPDCSNCWAINLCDICYAECYNSQGIDIKRKRLICHNTRNSALLKLCMYHEVLESNPDIIKQISLIERS